MLNNEVSSIVEELKKYVDREVIVETSENRSYRGILYYVGESMQGGIGNVVLKIDSMTLISGKYIKLIRILE